jgi:hypothetical protein
MTPTAEQRERDRIRYANMTDEQHQARIEGNREAKARRARERWAMMTPEVVILKCRCCLLVPPVAEFHPFCSANCRRNFAVTGCK